MSVYVLYDIIIFTLKKCHWELCCCCSGNRRNMRREAAIVKSIKWNMTHKRWEKTFGNVVLDMQTMCLLFKIFFFVVFVHREKRIFFFCFFGRCFSFLWHEKNCSFFFLINHRNHKHYLTFSIFLLSLSKFCCAGSLNLFLFLHFECRVVSACWKKNITKCIMIHDHDIISS